MSETVYLLAVVKGRHEIYECLAEEAESVAVAALEEAGETGRGRVDLRHALGTVYRATLQGPAGFSKPVALKVLHHDGQGLAHEACLGGLLQHRNLHQSLLLRLHLWKIPSLPLQMM